jgi:hypothetical protein
MFFDPRPHEHQPSKLPDSLLEINVPVQRSLNGWENDAGAV